ncbi:MAG: agmatine deiminase family protein [Verrucomicrobia bacterium]|nr:MAG: agmatine deiminase family protein [Verrucomicrobiota bacterium]TAE86127.1 MAG: agmatine deiminase family protein [Verrucomicrobiota bacterium]TAF23474.1 MAG: agmatine deiminase family protein [Verrucomicrobiota bacterium]TAF40104.1 MAG: agmatine deiminase family protein [Verrucomicrobiota bacterium]
MPPEWSTQDAVWLSWPVDDPRHWGGAKRDLIHAKFAEIAAAISCHETVRINAPGKEHDAIRSLCNRAKAVPERVELFDHPHNDVWCRDHGPIFLKHRESGALAVSDWEFNAWGGKFPPFDLDNSIPRAVAESLKLPRFEGGMILEGGAIEINGLGQLLTTEAVLLNPNRNPQLSRRDIEQKLRDTLGVHEILWLKQGIEGDDTDGHIDDLARFVDDTTIVACVEKNRESPNHAVLADNLRRLRDFAGPKDRPFDVVEIALPEACAVPGWRLPLLPASYVNFLIVNGGLLVPTFRQTRNDDHALGLLRELFPGREVTGIDCLDLVEEGGTLHCISQQQPA